MSRTFFLGRGIYLPQTVDNREPLAVQCLHCSIPAAQEPTVDYRKEQDNAAVDLGHAAMDDVANYAAEAIPPIQHPPARRERMPRADNAAVEKCITVLGRALAEWRSRGRVQT